MTNPTEAALREACSRGVATLVAKLSNDHTLQQTMARLKELYWPVACRITMKERDALELFDKAKGDWYFLQMLAFCCELEQALYFSQREADRLAARKVDPSTPAPDPVGVVEQLPEVEKLVTAYGAACYNAHNPKRVGPVRSPKKAEDALLSAISRLAQGGQSGRQEAINRMAFKLAEQDGCSDPHQLIWEGNPPEPWGEVWCKYTGQATELYDAQTPPTTTERAGA